MKALSVVQSGVDVDALNILLLVVRLFSLILNGMDIAIEPLTSKERSGVLAQHTSSTCAGGQWQWPITGSASSKPREPPRNVARGFACCEDLRPPPHRGSTPHLEPVTYASGHFLFSNMKFRHGPWSMVQGLVFDILILILISLIYRYRYR